MRTFVSYRDPRARVERAGDRGRRSGPPTPVRPGSDDGRSHRPRHGEREQVESAISASIRRLWRRTSRICKPDKELGFVPAGDKYFLGKADFGKGVNLVSLSDTDSKGKKVFTGHRQFLFVRDAVSAGRLPADDFHRHQWLRQAALQVRLCEARISGRSALPGVRRDAAAEVRQGPIPRAHLGRRSGLSTSCASTADMAAAGKPAITSTSTAGARTCSRECGCRRLCTAKKKNCTTR